MKKHLLFLLMLCIAGVMQADHLRDNLLIAAKLDGSQEVPAVATAGLGVASVVLNSMRDTACVNVSVTGLSGPITAAHFHDGIAGVNGPVVIDLTPFIAGNRITAIITGTDLADNLAKLLSGGFYINVHTAANASGEIRGQLLVETDWSFPVVLSGDLENPPVTTTAYGVGFFNLAQDSSAIQYMVVLQDLSGAATAAHLHGASLGANGGVIVDLTSGIAGNVISGTINAPSDTLIDSLMSSNIYINVHTAANPSGEIRSQLMNTSNYLYFDARLDGSQEVPPVITTAQGALTAWMNATLDTMWYDVAITGLSGSITAAHFHEGAVGVSGGIVIDLTAAITGNRITGFVAEPQLTDTLVNSFLRGDIYINVHTAANAAGEIRGQVYRLAREGYVFSLDGDQEVPPVVTTATGSGMVSIDRDQTNAHFMLTADGLTPTASHFHLGVAGQSGGVMLDIMPFMMNNGWFGYWNSSSAVPFTGANSLQFRNDSMYVNVHTAANASGEIRGQVLRGFQCFDVITAMDENETAIDRAVIYPNPVTETLQLEMELGHDIELSIDVVDATGRIIYSEQLNAIAGKVNHLIDLNKSAAGIYSLHLKSTDGNYVLKFVKE